MKLIFVDVIRSKYKNIIQNYISYIQISEFGDID